MKNWAEHIFSGQKNFEDRVSKVFTYQVNQNPIYRKFISAFGYSADSHLSPEEIPLLPVRAFKQAGIICEECESKLEFKSSGTGSLNRSWHRIADPELYHTAITKEFYRHFPADQYSILSYMPGYSNNPDSSLLYMIEFLIDNDPDGLSNRLPLQKPLKKKHMEDILEKGKDILLFGAAFGLLDLIEMDPDPLPGSAAILETGGMKTHRREISKKELRSRLSEGFNLSQPSIHSEYGMCELLSQCYAIGGEWFSTPDWVQVTIRNADDPFQICRPGEHGIIGMIDLANVHSCPFILTEDRGVSNRDGFFQVLGRWHAEDLRGCNFLIDRE